MTELPTPTVGSLSPSRANDFKACPLRYRFRVVDKLHERASPAAARGTLVHAVLERLFDLPAGDRTLAAAVALIPASWQQLLATDPALAELMAPADHPSGQAEVPSLLRSAGAMLAGYFDLEDPRRLEPAGRECRVEATLDCGLQLCGYVDRLDETASGEVRIVDYKTGRVPGERYQAQALFQLKFYALTLWRARGRVPRELRLLYLDGAVMLRYSPDDSELLGFERVITALWLAIVRATATGDFPARPSLSFRRS